jgi:hypothetical protein
MNTLIGGMNIIVHMQTPVDSEMSTLLFTTLASVAYIFVVSIYSCLKIGFGHPKRQRNGDRNNKDKRL